MGGGEQSVKGGVTFKYFIERSDYQRGIISSIWFNMGDIIEGGGLFKMFAFKRVII